MYVRRYKDNISILVAKNGLVVMSDNIRNLNLTVDEIEIIRMIRELSEGLEKLDFSDPLSTKAEFLQSEIDKLEEKLDQTRDNTLNR